MFGEPSETCNRGRGTRVDDVRICSRPTSSPLVAGALSSLPVHPEPNLLRIQVPGVCRNDQRQIPGWLVFNGLDMSHMGRPSIVSVFQGWLGFGGFHKNSSLNGDFDDTLTIVSAHLPNNLLNNDRPLQDKSTASSSPAQQGQKVI